MGWGGEGFKRGRIYQFSLSWLININVLFHITSCIHVSSFCSILTHTSKAKRFRSILLIKNEVLLKLVYFSEVMADIHPIRFDLKGMID